MVLAPDSRTDQEDTTEDPLWSSIQASNSAVQPKSCRTSGVIQGSEKLNERVFLNCGVDKRSKTEDLAKTILNIELMRRISTEVSPANSSNSSRASSRAGSRPVSRQSSFTGSERPCTPSIHSRSHTPSLLLNRPESRLSNCSAGLPTDNAPSLEIDAIVDSKSISSLPEGMRFMLERRNSG